MAPTLVASYLVNSPGADASTLTTPSFTPTVGELIVVKGVVLVAATFGFGSPTDSLGLMTFTRRVEISGTSPTGYVAIYTGVVTSGSAMTVSLPSLDGGTWHSMVVERWSSARVAASPVTVTGTSGGTASAPSVSLTTSAANSAISWAVASRAGGGGATRTYRSSATEDAYRYVASTGTVYAAYQAAATAGAQSVGMTAPAGYVWSLAGLEILDNSSSGGSTTVALNSLGSGVLTSVGSGSTTVVISSTPPPADVQLVVVPDPMASPPRVALHVRAPASLVDPAAAVTLLRTDPDGVQRRVILTEGAALVASAFDGEDYHAPFNGISQYTVAFGALAPGQPVTTGFTDFAPPPNLLPSAICAMGVIGTPQDNGWSSAWGSSIVAGWGDKTGAIAFRGRAGSQYGSISSGWLELGESSAGAIHTLAFEVADNTSYNDGFGYAGQARLYIDWQFADGSYTTTSSATPARWPMAGRALISVSGPRPEGAVKVRVAMYFVESLRPGSVADIAIWGVTLQEGASVSSIPLARWVDVPTVEARLDSTRTWLCHPSDPSLSVAVDAVTEISDRTSASTAVAHWPYGSKYPVPRDEGTSRALTGSMLLRVDSPETLAALRRLLSTSAPLWVNMAGQDAGSGWWDDPYGWVMHGDVGDVNKAGWVGYPYRHVQIPWTQIDVPATYLVDEA